MSAISIKQVDGVSWLRGVIAKGLCGVLAFLITSCGINHRSDRALATMFFNNEALFEKGVRLMRKNRDIFYVSSKLLLSRSYPSPIDVASHKLDYRKVLSDADWHALEEIVERLRLGDGIKVSQSGSVYFAVDGVSMSNGDSEKGIVYSDRAETTVNQSLDGRRYSRNVGL